MNTEVKIIRAAEAARRLGVCRQTVHKLQRSGTLPRIVLDDGQIGIPEPDLDAYARRKAKRDARLAEIAEERRHLAEYLAQQRASQAAKGGAA